MRATGFISASVDRFAPTSLRDMQPSAAELRAAAGLDLSLHPAELDAVGFEAARARMLGHNPDALRLRPPPRRARNHPELMGQVQGLVERVSGAPGLGVRGEGEARAVNAMLGALATLARVQGEVERARRSAGR